MQEVLPCEGLGRDRSHSECSQPGISGNRKERMDAGDMAKECLIRGKDIGLSASGGLEKC